MRLELPVFNDIGAFGPRIDVTPQTGAGRGGRYERGGDRAGIDQRLPPGHGLSRGFTPTTRPSRTGMMGATSRGARDASSVDFRTPSAFGESSLGATAPPWKNALC